MPKVPTDKVSGEVSDDEDTELSFEEGFWAVEVAPGKIFKQLPKVNVVHITKASLGVEAKGRNVLLNKSLALCVLTAGKEEHTTLDLRITPGQEMSLEVTGTSAITLSGYYESFENSYFDDDDEGELDSDEENLILDRAREAGGEDEDNEDDEEGKEGEGNDEDADTNILSSNKKRPAPTDDKTKGPANKKQKQEGGVSKMEVTSPEKGSPEKGVPAKPVEPKKGGNVPNKNEGKKQGGNANKKEWLTRKTITTTWKTTTITCTKIS